MNDDELHAAMPYTALLGATVDAAAADEVRLRLAWDATRCTAARCRARARISGLGR